MELSPLQRATIITALRKMFQPDSHFSICTFDTLCKLAHVVPLHDDRLILDALHCVSWRDMDPFVREEVATTIVRTLLGPQFNLDDLLVKPEPVAPKSAEPRSRLLRLLSGGFGK